MALHVAKKGNKYKGEGGTGYMIYVDICTRMRVKEAERGREEGSCSSREKCKNSTQTVYSKTEKKGHHNCCQSMHSEQECSMGPSASETKTAQSVALSP